MLLLLLVIITFNIILIMINCRISIGNSMASSAFLERHARVCFPRGSKLHESFGVKFEVFERPKCTRNYTVLLLGNIHEKIMQNQIHSDMHALHGSHAK